MMTLKRVHKSEAGGSSSWSAWNIPRRVWSQFTAITGRPDVCSHGIPGAIALVCMLAVLGDTLAYFFALPIPGAAIGMLLLLGLFGARGGPDDASAKVFDAATPYFPMFFVPAAVGVISKADVVAAAWSQLAFAVVFGTAVTIAITGVIAQTLLNRSFKEREK